MTVQATKIERITGTRQGAGAFAAARDLLPLNLLGLRLIRP